MNDLMKDLIQWDSKYVNELEVIYDKHVHKPDFSRTLIMLVKEEGSVQIGATWLLKKYLEESNNLKRSEVLVLFDTMDFLKEWQSQLHFLQMLPYIKLNVIDDQNLYQFLNGVIQSPNKFVRAWAYNGLFLLSQTYTAYQDEIYTVLDDALINEAPSVKARIRNILKEL